ncbi:hypothetical protein [Pseudonocardia sp. WMMC193]|uniref:hypothetical protein n=1 Tax=Pseudonocardia sp. WMMC193 TaxID=2911965 RepID=UPI001F3BA678|nr:hypothetical protein [Pseudonocardia sp. WMMC193]MCF7548897.1 hypothetical protein [Pseudonocardia sp. WMMC193]
MALTGAAALGTFKLATQGVGDAFSAAASGDAEAYSEAVAKLAPSAKAAAAEVNRLGPRLRAMQQDVQDNFFRGYDEAIRGLGETVLPVLEKQLGSIATQMGQMGTIAADALMQPAAVDDLNKVLGGTATLFDGLKTAPADVLDGILALAGAGSSEMEGLGNSVGNAAQRFREWAREAAATGQVNKWITNAKEEFAKLGGVLRNVGSIVGTVYRGLSSGGADFLGSLEETTAQLDRFLKTAEGQDLLRELGETLSTVADVSREVLMTALRELAPVIVELAPLAREVARAIGDFLVSALETLGPLLRDAATFLSANKDTIADLVPIVVSLAAAYKGLSILKDVKGWADTALGALRLLGGAPTAAAGSAAGKGFASNLLGGLKGGLGVAAVGTIGLQLADNLIPPDAGEGIGVGFARDMLGEMAETFRGEGDIFQAWDVGRWISNPLNMAVEMGKRKLMELFDVAPDSGIELNFAANTFPAQEQVASFMNSMKGKAGTININGRDDDATQVLAELVQRVNNGNGTVTINGEDMPADQALAMVIDQINRGVGTVTVNGQTIPAGQALADILNRTNRSTANIGVGADTSRAQGVIDGFIQMNNGRRINIMTSVTGSGGIASAGRLATGGPVRGPGTGTSDTAGLFALSNGEWVLKASDVKRFGGFAGVARFLALLRSGSIGRMATGGPVGGPSYLGDSSRIIRSAQAASPSVTVGGTSVRVEIDGQEFRGMIRAEIDRDNRTTRRLVGSGAGRGR